MFLLKIIKPRKLRSIVSKFSSTYSCFFIAFHRFPLARYELAWYPQTFKKIRTVMILKLWLFNWTKKTRGKSFKNSIFAPVFSSCWSYLSNGFPLLSTLKHLWCWKWRLSNRWVHESLLAISRQPMNTYSSQYAYVCVTRTLDALWENIQDLVLFHLSDFA